MLLLEVSRHCCDIFAMKELKERKNRRNTFAAWGLFAVEVEGPLKRDKRDVLIAADVLLGN